MIKAFRRGDIVLVNRGKYRFKVSIIKKVIKNNGAIISNINLRRSSIKSSKYNPTGYFINKESFINISNISHYIHDRLITSKISRLKVNDNLYLRFSNNLQKIL